MAIEKYIIDKSDLPALLRGEDLKIQPKGNIKGFCVEIAGNLTNGDMIKAMFPNIDVSVSGDGDIIDVYNLGVYCETFDTDWWNAPYKADKRKTISREKVIEQLNKLKSFHNGSYGEAINFAIESIKVDMAYDLAYEKAESYCDDCISRQAVLEYIEGEEAELGHSSENELVCRNINELPSVIPLTKTKVLDKIKAEIKALSPEPTAYDVVDGNPVKDAIWETLIEVDKILDKYKIEREET